MPKKPKDFQIGKKNGLITQDVPYFTSDLQIPFYQELLRVVYIEGPICLVLGSDFEGSLACALEPGDKTNFWRIFLDLNGDLMAGTIAHESLHVAAGVLRHRGFKLTSSSEEAYTYLLGFIVEHIHYTLDKIHQHKFNQIPQEVLDNALSSVQMASVQEIEPQDGFI